jgi:dihydrodipicolinate synthase/N-acetylneuraminate lyase
VPASDPAPSGDKAGRERLKGVVPPLVTPFLPDGGLDLASFEGNVEALSAFDLAGYLVMGSNGEASSLEEDEKLALVRAARKHARRRLVLAGTGLESTRATIAFTRKAADAGAEMALVLTPCYYKPQMTLEVLRRHFEAVADASPIPVLLYSVPVFTGLPWPLPLSVALASHPRILGMKESSGDVGLLGRIVAAVPPSFAVLCGSAPVLYPALCVGAPGGVVAVANCAPRPMAALYRAWESGDHARARRLQEAITPLAVAVTATHGVPGLKAAMDLAGRRGGAVRSPLLPVAPAVRDELRVLLDRAENAV